MATRSKYKGKGSNRSGQGGNVSLRCHFQLLQQVPELLSAANLSHFRDSCFGHLLEITEMQFQGQLYHILVRNHLMADNPSRLHFHIYDKVHEFSPAEFALITGLKLSGYYEPPTSSLVHALCFSNKKTLKFEDISNAFKQECEISGGDSELSLKLAFVFVLYSVLLTRDNNIQMQFLHLVDDIDKFNDYPWGYVSFEYLVEATLSRKEVLDNQLRQGKKPAYEAFGFLMALQIWAYEVIPDLGRHCAQKIEGKEHVFPRMLRWAVPGFCHYDDLMRFFPAELVEPRQRHLSPAKLLPEVGRMASPPKRKGRAVDIEGQKKKRKRPTTRPRRSARINTSIPSLDSTVESKSHPANDSPDARFLNEDVCTNVTLSEIIAANLKELLVRVASIEKVMRSCRCLMNVGEEVGANKGVGYPVPEFKKNNDDSTPLDYHEDDVEKVDTIVLLGRPSLQKGSCTGELKSARSSALKLFIRNPSLYDPMHAFYMAVDAKPFQDWYDNARDIGIPCETPLPISSRSRVDWDWFTQLRKRDGWLSSEHIDALTNLLLFKYNRAKSKFDSGWTLIEALSTVIWRLTVEWRSTECIWDADGLCSGQISLRRWLAMGIVVYDSTSKRSDWPRIAQQFENISRFVPLLCQIAGLWVGKQRKEPLKPVWDVVQFRHPSQQGNDSDCGVMAIKYMECLVSDFDLSQLTPDRCGIFRRSYCAELFDLGLKYPAS
ncbi:hypothetical protein C2S52_023430 [Perilla frutescens var. hirtella]|nr:hypothetical protein C2S52_023430 [Perilla frutescens var. hirtella]